VPSSRRRLLAGLVALGLFAAGCGDDDDTASTTLAATDAPTASAAPAATDAPVTTAAAEPAVKGDVTVFAAASLTDAFTELGEAFTAANPDATVTFNFAASSELVTQIGEGAPADVFASADVNNMAKLTDAGNNASEPVVFTTNLAEIIVGPGNPKGITGVADLASEDLIVISCALEVPCGRYAQQILDNAGVTVTFKSLDENVRAVVSKVTLGEADAGIVYVTDVISAGDAAEGVEIPADINVVAEYPIAVTKDAPNPAAAQTFINFVLSAEGQAILDSYGFVSP
jgi:molybdate transport system substrate-binding protein